MSVKVEISKSLFVINSISSVGSRLLNVTILVWMQQHLLRRISPDEYAIYPVVAAVMFIVPLVSSFLTGGVARYIIDACARGDDRRTSQIISSVFPLLLLSAVMFIAVGGLFAWHIDHILTIPPGHLWDARIMMALLIWGFALQLPLLPFSVGFDVCQRYVLMNILQLAQQLLRIAILFALLFGINTRVLWVVVASVSSNLVYAYVAAAISRRLVPDLRYQPHLFRWATMRELMSFGIWTTVAKVADIINGSDTIVLNKLGTSLDVTTFYIGQMFDNQIRSVLSVATEPIQPALTALNSRGEINKMGTAYLRGGCVQMWAALFAATPLVIYYREVITLYVGQEFLSAALVMILLLAVYPFAFSNKMLFRIGIAMARIRAINLGTIGKEIVNLGLTLYMVGVLHWGSVGSALGTCVSGIVVQVLYFWPLALRMVQVSWGQFMRETFIPGMLPALAGSVVWLALKMIATPGNWFQLGFYTALGYVPYVIVMFMCLQSSERRDLAEICARIWNLLRLRRPVPSENLP